MASQVFEGTWEEVKLPEAELVGRHVRLTVEPDKPETHKKKTQSPDPSQPKILRARGVLAALMSSEEYFREKREDTAREDCSL